MKVSACPSLLFCLLSSNNMRHLHKQNPLRQHRSTNHKAAAEEEKEVSVEPSRWQRRTAKRRQRTEKLLHSIEDGGLPLFLSLPFMHTSSMLLQQTNNNDDHQILPIDIPTLNIPSKFLIDWDTVHPDLDPVQGGKLRPGSPRGLRKRAQVQAFYSTVSSIILEAHNRPKSIDGVTIIDAGCGAGNLAIALAGLLRNTDNPHNNNNNNNIKVLAVDVNNQALERLSERAARILPPHSLETCCADLANYDYIKSQIPSNHKVIVVSLHACGAASDMAMNLAFHCNNAPFVVCPCCTAKSLTKRRPTVSHEIMEKTKQKQNTDRKDTPPKQQQQQQQQSMLEASASFQRSGATDDIEYPRSMWLRNKLWTKNTNVTENENSTENDTTHMDGQYTLLAKVADVGLGPQTPSQQRDHQRRAKKIVELDRAMAAFEHRAYDVQLVRIQDHDPKVYGKGEMLVGVLNENSTVQ